jgi:hypothetical protein
MKTLSNNRTRRRTAMAMMLVWLFALVTGVANACAVPATATYGHAQVGEGAALAPWAKTVSITAEHLGAVVYHDADSGHSKPPCLKAWGEDLYSIAIKVPSVLDLTDPGFAPLPAIVRIAFSSADRAPRRAVDARPPPFGPPVRLLYSRLAL